MVQYLIKSPRHLAQYLACNALPKGYLFYSMFWIPEGKDELLVDAKLLFTYDAHLSKERQYRRRKAGLASVKYLRCGRLCLLLSTKGKSNFFERESFKDARNEPLHVAGYALRVDKDTGKVTVRIHDEAQRKMRRDLLAHAGEDARTLETRIFGVEFLAFRGVQDNVYHLIKNHLNPARKLLRKPPLDWERCIRRKIKPEPVFLPTPKEIEDLLRYESRRT